MNAELLNKYSVKGGVVATISQIGVSCLQILTTILLARILKPDDFGLVGMAAVISSFAALFSNLGLSSAAIQSKDLTLEQRNILFWINLSLGMVIALVVCCLSPVFAGFYNREELVRVLIILSLQFVFSGAQVQYIANFSRDLNFIGLATVNLMGAFIGFVAAYISAKLGLGYWAIVIGMLTMSLVRLVTCVSISTWQPSIPKKLINVRQLVKFGWHVSISEFIAFGSRNCDNLLIGKYCGAYALGIYGRAYQLLMFPIAQIKAPIHSVAFPVLSKLDGDSEEFADYYCNVIQVVSLITMPIVALLYVVAEPVVLLLLGDEWHEVVYIFRILAIVAFIQSIVGMRGLPLFASGKSSKAMKVALTGSFIVMLGFFIGIHWGIKGICYSYIITTWLPFLPLMTWAFKGTAIKLSNFVKSISYPALSSLLIMMTTLWVNQFIYLENLFLEVVFDVVTFGVLYVLMVLINGGTRKKFRLLIETLSKSGES